MTRGYVKLWRKTLDSGIISNGPAWQLFGYLLMNACHVERKQVVRGTIFELKPGDVVFSRAMAATKLDLGEQQIRTALNLLKKLEIVTSRSTNKITIISFVKWDIYNGNQPATNQQDNQPPNQHLTSNQPASDLHLEINKNERIKEILNPPISPQGGTEGVEKTSPSFAGDDPPIEFQELRKLWDTEMRTEGPMAGWKEYKQAKAARYWPGVSRIAQDVEERKAACVWNPGYEIGLGRYLAEQTWLAPVKARASPEKSGQPSTPTEFQKNMQDRRMMASALLQHRKQEKQNGKRATGKGNSAITGNVRTGIPDQPNPGRTGDFG